MYVAIWVIFLGRYVFLGTGFTCAHLKSSGNKSEHSGAFVMYIIGIINTSRHVSMSIVGSGSRSQDLLKCLFIFSHFSDCGWFKRSELRIHFWNINIYNVCNQICESGMDKAKFGFKMTRKGVRQ